MAYDITWPTGTLAGREFFAGDLVLLSNGNPADYEIVEVESVVDDTITLATVPLRLWPPGSRITPLRQARIDQMPARTSPTSHVSQVSIRFEFDDAERNIDDEYWDAATPWPFRTNWATAVETGYDRIVYTLDVETGTTEITDPSDVGRVTQRAQLTLNGRATVNSFRSWVAMTRGRALRFWKDSGTHDLEPVGVIGGSLTLDVATVGYSDWFVVPQDARRAIAIVMNDGAPTVYVQIVSVEKRSGFDRIVLSDEIPEISRSAIDRISYVMPVRFDQDVFEIEHLTDNLAAVRSSVAVRSSDFDGMPTFPAPPVLPITLLLDTFTAANGTDPASRDMDIHPSGNARWTNQASASVIQDNMLKLLNIGASGTIYADWPSALFTAGARCLFAKVQASGLPTSGTFTLNTYDSLGSGNAQLRLHWRQGISFEVNSYDDAGGGATSTVSDNVSSGAGQFRIALWAEGSRVVAIVNGAITLDDTITISTQTLNGFDVSQNVPNSTAQGVEEVGVYANLSLAQAIAMTV